MKKLFVACLLALPVTLLALSHGPIRRTGAKVDGGLDCASCHTTFAPANSDARGSVAIDAATYVPSSRQTLRIAVRHPEASRWGFQLTARSVTDESVEAGHFAPSDIVQVRCDDGTDAGSAPPCGDGQREFAEYASFQSTAAGAGYEFLVDWTPPTSDIGAIRFYVASTAANGDGTPAGDRVYTVSKTVLLSSNAACGLTRKPTVRALSNAASFAPAIAPGALVSVFGMDFQVPGTSRGIGAGDLLSGSFPSTLGCIAVEINGQRAPITYVQQDQINIEVPNISAAGPLSVVVIANPDKPNELRSDVATVATIQSVAPGLFTFGGSKSAAAVFAQSGGYVARELVRKGGHPAMPGDIVSLFGTGFGTTSPAVLPGALASGLAQLTSPVTVTLGGITLAPGDILYAGLAPGAISGLYQFNIRIPANAPDGDAPVTISVGGQSTQADATLPISHP